jgi:hypothetical protein
MIGRATPPSAIDHRPSSVIASLFDFAGAERRSPIVFFRHSRSETVPGFPLFFYFLERVFVFEGTLVGVPSDAGGPHLEEHEGLL